MQYHKLCFYLEGRDQKHLSLDLKKRFRNNQATQSINQELKGQPKLSFPKNTLTPSYSKRKHSNQNKDTQKIENQV